jgi:carbamoyl-phosphate synthase large subunit
MQIVYDEKSLRAYTNEAVEASPEHPVLIDKFLKDAIEIDVDALADGERVVIGGIMEHIEEAGVHSGDSACSLPPYSLGPDVIEEIRRQTVALALGLGVVGLMNVQFAVQDSSIYVLEVNPRASRTVPFVSKATGVPLAKIAARVMAGKSLEAVGFVDEVVPLHVSVKEAVFPFVKFPGVDTVLGPEMKSTGEVMGIDSEFGKAFAKSQIAAGNQLPVTGTAFLSVRDHDKPAVTHVARRLLDEGFAIIATQGTAAFLEGEGLDARVVKKVQEGRPHVVDVIVNGEADLLINTTQGSAAIADSYSIRRAALEYQVPYFTTMAGARAAVSAIRSLRRSELEAKSLQEYYEREDKA